MAFNKAKSLLRYANLLSPNLKRNLSVSVICRQKAYNIPPNGNELQRPAGIASFCRLPVQKTTEGLDVAVVGITLDSATSNRSGTRFGPRQIRTESSVIWPENTHTGAKPFHSLTVADVGDVFFTMFDVPTATKQITEAYKGYLSTGCKTLTLGGDHSITYPILKAYKERFGKVGLIHIDAHTDTSENQAGSRFVHGSPFRRAVEDDLLDTNRVVQIGLRGSGYEPGEVQWNKDQGFRCIPASECWHKSLTPLMEEVRQQMGDGPVYLTFDIDSLDPAFAPGTGTPEIAGLTPIQALEIIRGCRGLNIIGGDLVEVSPPYDVSGNTALLAANLLFEILCVFPGVYYPDEKLKRKILEKF